MRTLQGTITSNRMAKTAVVRVDRLRQHAKYRKFYRVSATYKAHVEDAAGFGVGDIVTIQETRPLSKGKRWKVVALVRRAPVSVAAGDAPGGGGAGGELDGNAA